MRLNRFLAAAGLGSRRSCDQLIAAGSVVINGHRIEKLATTVGPDDDVRVNGRQVRVALPVTLVLNKPRGYVVTRSDERGRRTIYDLLDQGHANLFHVGRLDKESEGLLLMTNDGALSQKLLHPSHGVEKEYEVELDKSFNPELSAKLTRGVHIEGGRGRFETVRIVGPKFCVWFLSKASNAKSVSCFTASATRSKPSAEFAWEQLLISNFHPVRGVLSR